MQQKVPSCKYRSKLRGACIASIEFTLVKMASINYGINKNIKKNIQAREKVARVDKLHP
jgi:hypothetical protein